MNAPISIQGPVEIREGKLTLMIPLEVGGNELIPCTKGIADVEGEYLRVTFPDWLVQKLGWIHKGTIIEVDNKNGKFNFSLIADSN
jgi:hypothetical protein